MPNVILTGGPGVGKTTVLAELAARGHATVAESARAVIAERRAAGLSPLGQRYTYSLRYRTESVDSDAVAMLDGIDLEAEMLQRVRSTFTEFKARAPSGVAVRSPVEKIVDAYAEDVAGHA